MFGRKLVRFSLASLLTVITVAALVLGYTKWKVAQRQENIKQLRDEGVAIFYDSRKTSWLEYVASGEKDILTAGKVVISIVINGDEFRVAHYTCSSDEAPSKVNELAKRAKQLDAYRVSAKIFSPKSDEGLVREFEGKISVPINAAESLEDKVRKKLEKYKLDKPIRPSEIMRAPSHEEE